MIEVVFFFFKVKKEFDEYEKIPFLVIFHVKGHEKISFTIYVRVLLTFGHTKT